MRESICPIALIAQFIISMLVAFLATGSQMAYARLCDCEHTFHAVYPQVSISAKQGVLDIILAADPKPAPSIGSTTASGTLSGNAYSTTLQSGTSSTTLQTGTQSALIQGGTQGAMVKGQVEHDSGPVNILLLIDASYSMKENLSGSVQKMDAAKQVLQNALARIPTEVNLGLRVFGQSFTNDPATDCQQSALLVPMGQGNRRSIIEQMRQIHPFGLTPLTYALMQAERDLRLVTGPKTLILITDGAETCGGNPCEYVRRLNQIGIKIKVDIVGLGLKRERDARAQLNCIAEVSGGKYYDANTAAELIDSVTQSVSKAISGRVIIKGKDGTETPPDLVPIETILGK